VNRTGVRLFCGVVSSKRDSRAVYWKIAADPARFGHDLILFISKCHLKPYKTPVNMGYFTLFFKGEFHSHKRRTDEVFERASGRRI
jgi:hypothetical protein